MQRTVTWPLIVVAWSNFKCLKGKNKHWYSRCYVYALRAYSWLCNYCAVYMQAAVSLASLNKRVLIYLMFWNLNTKIQTIFKITVTHILLSYIIHGCLHAFVWMSEWATVVRLLCPRFDLRLSESMIWFCMLIDITPDSFAKISCLKFQPYFYLKHKLLRSYYQHKTITLDCSGLLGV